MLPNVSCSSSQGGAVLRAAGGTRASLQSHTLPAVGLLAVADDDTWFFLGCTMSRTQCEPTIQAAGEPPAKGAPLTVNAGVNYVLEAAVSEEALTLSIYGDEAPRTVSLALPHRRIVRFGFRLRPDAEHPTACVARFHVQQPATTAPRFVDNFDRPDAAAPGNGWATPADAGVQPPFVHDKQLCGTTQSAAFRTETFDGANLLRVSYTFTASDAEGFETYVLLQTADNQVVAVGCDGGYGNGHCTPVFSTLDGSVRLVERPAALAVNQAYTAELTVHRGLALWRLWGDGGLELARLDARHPALDQPAQLSVGLLVGRQGLTCADDFAIEQDSEFSTVFFDNFERPDGAAGPNYLEVGPQPAPSIVGGWLCGTGQNAMLYKDAVSAAAAGSTVRVSYLLKAAAVPALESYALATGNASHPDLVFLAGVDAGETAAVQWVRLPDDGNGDAARSGPNHNLREDHPYVVEALYDGATRSVLLRVTDAVSLRPAFALNGQFEQIDWAYFGAVMGRVPGNLTCIDRFHIQRAHTASALVLSPRFFDDFVRPDGPLGPSYAAYDGYPSPWVSSGEACASNLSVAVLAAGLTHQEAATVRVGFTFRAGDTEGFQALAVFLSADEADNATLPLVVGLDGGWGGAPIIEFVDAGGSAFSVSLPAPPLSLNVAYRLEATLEQGARTTASLHLTGPDGRTLAAITADVPDQNGAWYGRVGVVVGRGGGAPTCLDNLLVDTASSNYTLLFADSFDRPDGPLGPEWVASPAADVPSLSIEGGRACGYTQSAAAYNHIVDDKNVRVVYSFTADSEEGLESYALASYRQRLFVAGVDGGYVAAKIEELGGRGHASDRLALRPNTTYTIDAQFVAGLDVVVLRVYEGPAALHNTRPAVAVAALRPGALVTSTFGLLAGRSGRTCADDFALYVSGQPQPLPPAPGEGDSVLRLVLSGSLPANRTAFDADVLDSLATIADRSRFVILSVREVVLAARGHALQATGVEVDVRVKGDDIFTADNVVRAVALAANEPESAFRQTAAGALVQRVTQVDESGHEFDPLPSAAARPAPAAAAAATLLAAALLRLWA